MSEEKGKCGCTFIYRGSGHVVETQGCIHIINVLQESKEIFHLFECDALHKTEKCGQSYDILCFLQVYGYPVNNQSIHHDNCTILEETQTTRESGQKKPTHMDEQCTAEGQGNRRDKTHMYTYKQTNSHTAATLLMSPFAKNMSSWSQAVNNIFLIYITGYANADRQ